MTIFITLIISMIVVLFLVGKKVNIGYSLITGSIILAILNGKGIPYIIKTFARTFVEKTTINLVSTILLITILGYLMDRYGILDRMIIALEKILRSAKATILIAPAIIGTLLVTGGALMSCPVVEKLGDKLNLPKDKRAAINMVFRHALYFMFPLSPTIIMAAEIGGFDVMDFVKLQFPISIVMYIFGYFFYLKGYKDSKVEPINYKSYLYSIFQFLVYASPILVSLLGVVVLNIPFHISLLLGVIISIVINLYDKKQDPKFDIKENIFKTMYKGIKPSMLIAVIGIMIYKNVVNDMEELYIQLENLLHMGVPLEILIIVAASAISLSLASTQPSIAILFPMILPLASDYHTKLVYAMFIYANAFLFYYISPLHLCQVLTLDYFKIRIKDLYKNYSILLPVTYLAMFIIYFLNIR